MPADVSLSGGKGSGKTIGLIVGVLLAGGIGFFVWSSKKTHEERKQHAAFIEHFQGFEKDELMKFWLCALGPNIDGSMAPSPDAITRKVDSMFATDFRAYPNKLREDCAKDAKDARDKLAGLGALPQYNAALETYGKAIVGISEALDDWAKSAPEQVQSQMVVKNTEEYGNAWHAYSGGNPTAEISAYDAFLHCSDADLEKHKDTYEFAKHVFDQCKDSAYRDKLLNECGKLVTENKPAAPTKNWKTVLQKLGPDGKDGDAFGDCLRKARKGKVKDNLAPVGMKWVAFREAREAVLKIGQEALKE